MAGLNPFYGIDVIGYTPDRSAAFIRLQRAAAFRLAEGCSPEFEPFFKRIASSLREPMMTLISPPPPPSPDERRAQIPRELKPYMKYTEEQMAEAWAQSQVGSDRHYCSEGYARLYLNRAALVEMYGRPPHLRLVYANILKWIDGSSGLGCVEFSKAPQFPIPDERASLRVKPYTRFNEAVMMKALKALNIPRAQIKISYGLLAVTVHRDTVFRLCRRSRYAKRAIAYLLRLYDELKPAGG
jgi:hypothetical protein